MNGWDDTASTTAALAAFGLKLEEPPEVEVHGIWPDNVQSFLVFGRLQNTQWRVAGMGGVMGLDYASLPFFLELEGVPRAEWSAVTTEVQIMETEALRLIRLKADK